MGILPACMGRTETPKSRPHVRNGPENIIDRIQNCPARMTDHNVACSNTVPI